MTTKNSKKSPAYQRIKTAILHNIHSGKWQAGEAISTEMALAEEFGVSRMTVNRALKELSEDRVLERRQGSGTFVAQQQFNHTFVEVRNIAEDLKSANRGYQAQVVSTRSLTQETLANELPKEVYDRFSDILVKSKQSNSAQLAKEDLPEALVYEVKIIHLADGLPIQFEERWVDAQQLPDFIEQDFRVVNTSDYLIEQTPLERGSYTIQALAAPKDIAQALQIAPNSPTLMLQRQTYSAGKVLTVVKMWHAGERYQFAGEL